MPDKTTGSLYMTIQEIKAKISAEQSFQVGSLNMVRQKDQNTQKPTEWVSHWDNDHRVRVTMHEEIMQTIKADPTFPGLALKKEVVPQEGERLSYVRYVVITPKDIEASF